MTPRANAAIFDPRQNYRISLATFWVAVVCLPVTMIARGYFSGFDLFEQVLIFLSWYSIIETSRNSVITSLIRSNGK